MKRLLGVISALVGAILIMFYVSKKYSLTPEISYIWLVPTVILSIFFVVLCGLRIQFFVSSLSNRMIGFLKTIKLELLGRTLYAIFPFKVYLPVRGLLMAKYLGIELQQAFAAVSFEFLADNSILIFVSLIFLTIFPKSLPTYLFWPLATLAGGLCAMLIIVFMCKLTKRRPSAFLKKIGENAKKLKVPIKILEKFTISLEEGVKQLFLIKKNGVYALCLSVLIFLAMATKTWFLFKALNIDINIFFVFFATAVSTLISLISMVPGGLVVRELTGVVIYTFFGVKPELATIALIIDRIITYLIIFSGGIYTTSEVGFDFILHMTEKQKPANENGR